MIYDIRLRLTHFYSGPAGAGRHRVRVVPQDLASWQTVRSWSVTGDPRPTEQVEERDFFGTPSSLFLHDAPHSQMQINMQARVERLARAPINDTSPPLSKIAQHVSAVRNLTPSAPHHFLGASERIAPSETLASYAQTQMADATSVWGGVQHLGHALHRDMLFDSAATTVDTSAEEAFAHRRGVCQDFAHIMISGLRGLGVPARYVSGYVRTEPPEGHERLEGADAMHAWVSAWCGTDLGWQEFDPTNGLIVDTDHITVGYGRDYFDVSPIKGALRSSGQSSVAQAVDVIPVDDY